MKRFAFDFSVAVAMGVLALLPVRPVAADHEPCHCEESICSGQGFRITLTDFQITEDSESVYTYSVCNEKGLGTDCEPPQDLSHVDFELPNLGCISDAQSISIAPASCVGPSCPSLVCGLDVKDPSCDLAGDIKVLKCDLNGDLEGNPPPGNCINVVVTIAGEILPGAGAVSVITKAGRTCQTNSICGPVCGCVGGGSGGSCLTRTAGFWGTHPLITEQFLPISVCGKTLSTTDVSPAPRCDSVTEALCVAPGTEGNRRQDKNPAREQLVRQLAAAKLNVAATSASGGNCGTAITDLIAQCETYCNRTQTMINRSGCVTDLDEFNNSVDTFPDTPAPFDAPGPASPAKCKQANGNGVLIISCP